MENLVKEKLERGQKIIGTMFQLGCPTAVECLGISGLDFFIIDTEHAPVDIESIRLFVLTSELRKITPFVRIKRISRDTVLNALDIGAGGVIAPGVETVQQVEELVEFAKYPPEGSRGFCLTRTSAYGYDGSAENIDRYIERSNRDVLVIPQCETRGCLNAIDQIAAIKGVDGIFVGPYDLSVALGKPGNFDTPDFQAAIRKVMRACQKAHKFVLIFSASLERSQQYLSSGFDGIVFNSDADMFIDTYKKMLAELRTRNQTGQVQSIKADIYGGYLSSRNGNARAHTITSSKNYQAELALIGGTLVLPGISTQKSNIYIKDGKISGISMDVLPAVETFDLNGKHILPGIIDPHTHFGIGTDFDTDLQSETLSAAVGGLTTVGCFISAKDARVNTYSNLVEKINRLSFTDVVPHFVIGTKEQINEIPVLVKEKGILTFKVYLHGIDGLIPAVDDAFVIDVMEELVKTGVRCLLFVHCENDALVRRATHLTNQKYGTQTTITDWEETHPPMAEEEAIMRIAFFAKKLKQPIYVVHVSSAEGAEMVKSLKAENPYLYAETTSPYLTVTADQFDTTIGLMEPPLRKQADQDRLWESIIRREIDTIGTDNVALTLAEKGDAKNVWAAFPGYPVLATHLPSILNEGVIQRGIAIEDLMVPMTKRPAELLGLYPSKGTLLPGSIADIVVVDMNLCKTVDHKELFSRTDFSLYQGKNLCGWPVMTIKNGMVVAQNGKPTGKRPACKAIVSNSSLR